MQYSTRRSSYTNASTGYTHTDKYVFNRIMSMGSEYFRWVAHIEDIDIGTISNFGPNKVTITSFRDLAEEVDRVLVNINLRLNNL